MAPVNVFVKMAMNLTTRRKHVNGSICVKATLVRMAHVFQIQVKSPVIVTLAITRKWTVVNPVILHIGVTTARRYVNAYTEYVIM